MSFDLTRVIFKCKTLTAVDLNTFGDLAKLVKGLAFRARNGTYQNIFNVKDNGELAGIMFDFQVAAATNPQQGQDGFTARLTYAGMEKIGVAKELPIGTDFESIVQDNLLVAQSASRQITLLEIIAEGHITEP